MNNILLGQYKYSGLVHLQVMGRLPIILVFAICYFRYATMKKSQGASALRL